MSTHDKLKPCDCCFWCQERGAKLIAIGDRFYKVHQKCKEALAFWLAEPGTIQ